VPLLMSLTAATSVIDIGCGPGNWLAALRERGVADIFGVDQNDYGTNLRIPRDLFRVADLNVPFHSERKFDLVICMEVAEHLPPASAPILINSLTALGDIVLFSAAIPFQGGTDHRNEQWPEYWRLFFATHGFVPVDCIRPRVWDNDDVAWWYSQNMILYVKDQGVVARPPIRAEIEHPTAYPLALVHPALYAKRMASVTRPSHSPLMHRIISAMRRVRRRG